MRKACLSLTEFDLFVPFLMASCQSDLLSVMITSTASQCCFISGKFSKLSWFPGTDLFLQVQEHLYEVSLGGSDPIWTTDVQGSNLMTCRRCSDLFDPDKLTNVSIPSADI